MTLDNIEIIASSVFTVLMGVATMAAAVLMAAAAWMVITRGVC